MASNQGVKQSVASIARQSPPLDFPGQVHDTWLRDKTILITGGASGFGAGFVKKWATAGATIVFGDLNKKKGNEVMEAVIAETGNERVHFVPCDVTKWEDQVHLFRAAVNYSPHGGIDTVVLNAGITDSALTFERPTDLESEHPRPPDLSVINVNLTGVLYGCHLAMYYLPKNPSSMPADPECDPGKTQRDRHIILIGSLASTGPVPTQALYTTSKHGVLGLFRSLRTTTFTKGIRVSFIAPYFIETPMLTFGGRTLLAGGNMGKPEDVVEAATRFASDPRIVGRAVAIGPRLRVEEQDGDWSLVEDGSTKGIEKPIWEIYPHDLEDVDLFVKNLMHILNRAVVMNGRIGWAKDMFRAVLYALTSWWRS